MLNKVTDLTSQGSTKGLNTHPNIFSLEKGQTPDCMDVKFEYDGSISKRYGTTTRNTVSLSATAGTAGVTTAGWASFDFGAGASSTPQRWYCVAAGTGVYASSDMGVSFVTIATDRTATYQYFERSKNVLVCCSNAYDKVLYWSGSAGTYAQVLNISAPLAKYAINFQGYLILLNSSTNKRGFYYEDENYQLTNDWSKSFSIPSSFDDEITGCFILLNKLFVSTRYKLFAVSYVGGNPDWAYREVKSWGFVPRTIDKITYQNFGEIVAGLDWSRRLRIFDGSEDKLVSDPIDKPNGMCDFALQNVSYAGSGLIVSFGKTDDNEQVYKLAVTVGANSGQVTHFLCLNGRTGEFYPYDYTKLKLMTMCMAESANRRFLVAVDQSGWVHMMDRGNKDGDTYAVNDHIDSPPIYEKSPSQMAKDNKIDMYFAVNSAGRVYYQDRADFSDTFKTRHTFSISSANKIQHLQQIDIPFTQNVYQYRLTSSSSTTVPWVLNRTDFFLKGLGIGTDIKN